MTAWNTTECPGYRTKTLKRGNCTIVVHRPILTEAERIKQEERVVTTLTHCKSFIHRKETKA